MIKDKPWPGSTDDSNCIAVLLVLYDEYLASDDARKARDVGNTDGQYNIKDTVAQDRHQDDGQKDKGEGHHAVHDPHDDGVDDAAHIA